MMNSILILIFLFGIFNGISGDCPNDLGEGTVIDIHTFDYAEIQEILNSIAELKDDRNDTDTMISHQLFEVSKILGKAEAAIEDIKKKISSINQASNIPTDCSETITNNFSEIKTELSSVDVIKGKIDELLTTNTKFFGALNATLEKTISEFHSALEKPNQDLKSEIDVCERESTQLLETFKKTFETNLRDMRDIVAKEEGTCEKLTDLTNNIEGILTNETVKCEMIEPPAEPIEAYDSCKAALNGDSRPNGIFDIKLPNTDFGSFKAFCMKDHTDGEIWTIIQKRHDGTVDFNESWENYKHGFGNPSGDYWIGLEKIYALTNSKRHQLWILMESKGGKYSIVYDNFVIGGEKEKYKIKSFGEFTSTTENIEKNCLNEEFEAAVGSGLSTGFWNPKKCFNLNEQVISGGKRQIKATLKKYPVRYTHMAIKPVE